MVSFFKKMKPIDPKNIGWCVFMFVLLVGMVGYHYKPQIKSKLSKVKETFDTIYSTIRKDKHACLPLELCSSTNPSKSTFDIHQDRQQQLQNIQQTSLSSSWGNQPNQSRVNIFDASHSMRSFEE
jgi:hypothetical protein